MINEGSIYQYCRRQPAMTTLSLNACWNQIWQGSSYLFTYLLHGPGWIQCNTSLEAKTTTIFNLTWRRGRRNRGRLGIGGEKEVLIRRRYNWICLTFFLFWYLVNSIFSPNYSEMRKTWACSYFHVSGIQIRWILQSCSEMSLWRLSLEKFIKFPFSI